MNVELVGRVLSTLPEDDDHPYRTGPWRPQTTEWNADDLEVVAGEIPADLDGVYLRNTENPVHPAKKYYHPFDGDGMVHVVGFRDRPGLLPQPLHPAPTGSWPRWNRAERCGRASPSRRRSPTGTAGAPARG